VFGEEKRQKLEPQQEEKLTPMQKSVGERKRSESQSDSEATHMSPLADGSTIKPLVSVLVGCWCVVVVVVLGGIACYAREFAVHALRNHVLIRLVQLLARHVRKPHDLGLCE